MQNIKAQANIISYEYGTQAPCCPVDNNRRFIDAYCLYQQGSKQDTLVFWMLCVLCSIPAPEQSCFSFCIHAFVSDEKCAIYELYGLKIKGINMKS